MFTSIKRLFLATTVLSLGLMAAAPAFASTASYAWSDISGQLTTTANRPVWASAYASGNWFYTDGQNLWNGGQAYRYDGATQVNITTDLRNAGLNRVDDIISDGQSVLYLQDMAARTNQFTAVEYLNGSYVNVTTVLRNAFSSTEGIGNVSGRNGDWYITTSKGHVLHWNGNTTMPSQVTLPTNLQSNLYNAYQDFQMNYLYGGFSYKNTLFRVVPISGNGWLFVFGASFYQWSAPYPVTSQMYRWTNGSFTDISSNLPTSTDLNAFSNGSSALIVESCTSCGTARNYLIVDGSTVHSYSSNVDLYGTAVWTGQSWMIFGSSDKHVRRIVDGFSEDLGEARDYFVTGASNGNGTVLLGGAVSVLGNSQPTTPLTAKLVKVTETGSTSNNTTNTTSQSGISYWTWLDPNQSTIRRDQTLTFNVGTWSQNGIKRVEIYVNGSVRRTCDLGTAYGNQSCSAVLYGGDYAVGTTVSFNAKITDGKDQVAWTPLQNLTVTDANGNTSTSNTNTTTNADGNTWVWSTPETTVVSVDHSFTFNVGAIDPDGIATIEIFVNGSRPNPVRNTWKVCNLGTAYGNQECSLTIGAGSFQVGASVSVDARIRDSKGNTMWSDVRNYSITGSTSGSTPAPSTTNVDGSTWVWSTPETWMIKTTDIATFHVGAYDPNNIAKIEMVVNGTVTNTCNLGNAAGNQECTATISGSAYPVGTGVFVNAKVTDSQGNVMWSPSRTYWIATTSTPAPSSSNTTQTWVWSHPSQTTLYAGQASDFNVGAWDADGLRRIEIWVNGQVKQYCDLGTAYGNQQCAYQILANNYTAGSDIFVNAAVIDAKGNVAWSNSQTYHIQTSNLTNGSTDLTTNLPGWVQVSSDHDGGYGATDKVTFTASAQDADGIGRIDILVNAVLVKTCFNTSTCSYTGGPYGYRSSVSYGAKIMDKKGFALWTGYKTINKK